MASKPKTTEWFIKKAKSIYGDKFDYSKSSYTFSRIPIEIICRIHGSFFQRSNEHFKGAGCPICNRRWTLQEFIKKSIKIHGNRYDYSKSEYLDSKTKITIKCIIHGNFYSNSSNHFKGKGCPKCKHRISKPEIKWLDNLNIPKEYRQKCLIMKSGKRYEVDAFNPVTNTVYEFYGDYWHGNPNKFDLMEMNKKAKCTFGSLFKKTLDKEAEILQNGYIIVSIWEQDFLKSL